RTKRKSRRKYLKFTQRLIEGRNKVINNKVPSLRFAAIALPVTVWAGSALAQPVEHGGPPQIISHKTNPHMERGNPPAGSIGSMTPVITNHGGPVMGSPNVYLIWYGNWNQSNGSDTAAGQAIVRDF